MPTRRLVLACLSHQCPPVFLPSVQTLPPFCSQDGEHAYIRLNFNFGGSYEPCAKNPKARGSGQCQQRALAAKQRCLILFG